MTVSEPMLKHPGHGDQKVHGRKGGSASAAPAREGRRIESAEAMDEVFLSEIDDRALVPVSPKNANPAFARAMKSSVAERIEDRMSDVPTQDLVDAALNLRGTRAALDPTNVKDRVVLDNGFLAVAPKEQLDGYVDDLGREPAMPGSPMAEMYVRQAAVGKMVNSWATSSNDNNVLSLAIQDAATKEFGISNPAKWNTIPEIRGQVSELKTQSGNVHRKFLRAQYEETQSMLQSRGITEIVAYRGVAVNKTREESLHSAFSQSAVAKSVSITTRPISSFSTSLKVASRFSEYAGQRDDVGIVVKAMIPAKSILSTCITGNGCWAEKEITVIGDTVSGSAVNPVNRKNLWGEDLFPVEKAALQFVVDNNDLNADWIKTLSWDLPITEEGMEQSFGAGWRKKFERLPAWEAAPASLRLPAVVKFAPGLTPVLKHPGHPDQKVHAGGRGGSRAGMKIDENRSIQYGEIYVNLPGTEWEMKKEIKESNEFFREWDGNYDIRVASSRMMGITEGFTARGSRGTKVQQFLEDPSLANGGFFRAEGSIRSAAVLLEGSKTPLATGTRLYRGLKLADGDPRLSAKPGDVFEMPLSAFATAPALPREFATRIEEGRTSTMITVQGSARGHTTGEISGYLMGSEVIAQGRFRVADNRKTSQMVELTFEQVAYYDVNLGEWVDNA